MTKCVIVVSLLLFFLLHDLSSSIPNGDQLLILLGPGAHMSCNELPELCDMVRLDKSLNKLKTVQAIPKQKEFLHRIKMQSHLRLLDLGFFDIYMRSALTKTHSLFTISDPWVTKGKVHSMN